VSGPHKPWTGEPHSEALLARIRELCTLQDIHERTVALGQPLSLSAIHRMENGGGGSDEAWDILARALRVEVDTIRPVRGNLLEPQLVLPGTSSSS
jgi:hypothetical protein